MTVEARQPNVVDSPSLPRVRSRAAAALWLLMTTLSVGIALVAFRFLIAGPEVLYPEASSGAGPDTGDISRHFFVLLESHYLRFAAHFFFGPIALIIGPFQFVERWRRRSPVLHRRLGWVYVVCVGVSGLAGFVLAFDSFGGLTTHFGFGLLAVTWLYCTGQAVRHAAGRRFRVHREWMIRSFALTFAAVMLRIYIPILAGLGVEFDEVYQTAAWMCWVPNLIVAEHLIRRGAGRAVEGVTA
jgi:uncharacterized membrane protein